MKYEKIFYGHLSNYENEFDNLKEYLPEQFVNHDLLSFNNKLEDVKIGYIIIVDSKTNFDIVFYLYDSNNENISSNDPNVFIEIAKNNSLGNIEFYINNQEKYITISNVEIDPSIRGRRLAKYLIILSLLYSNIISPDIQIVQLDDMSDNFVSSNDEILGKKNLYRQLGFTYIDEGSPEMEGNILKIIANEIGVMTRKKSEQRMKYIPRNKRNINSLGIKKTITKKTGGKSKKYKSKSKNKSKKNKRKKLSKKK